MIDSSVLQGENIFEFLRKGCPLELPKVIFGEPFGTLCRLVGDFGWQCVAILQPLAHSHLPVIFNDFAYQGHPQDSISSRGKERSGDMVKEHLALLRGVSPR